MEPQVSANSITAALFVDFQNVFRNLASVNRGAPRAFATKPEQWLSWFQAGSHQRVGAEQIKTPLRRILVRRVYVDDSFRPYREHFTHGAGFTIIDCPRLTGEGKNAADIRMVVDILDTLQHPTRFDEFIILSSDADFTPVLHRLRAYDRISTIVSLKNISAALKSSCDFAVSEELFVREALGLNPTHAIMEPMERKETAKAAIKAEPASPKPLSPKQVVLALAGAKPAPMGEAAEPQGLEAIYKQLGLPPLAKETFARAFELWASESRNGHSLSGLQKLIRDGCIAEGLAVARNNIGAITYFLRRAGVDTLTFDNASQVASTVYYGVLRHAKAHNIEIPQDQNEELAALFGCQTIDISRVSDPSAPQPEPVFSEV